MQQDKIVKDMNIQPCLHAIQHLSLRRLIPSPEPNGGGCRYPSGTAGWNSSQCHQHTWIWGFDIGSKESPGGFFYDLPCWNFPGRVDMTLPYTVIIKPPQPGTYKNISFFPLAACHGHPAVWVYSCIPVWHSCVRLYHSCCSSYSGVPAQICVRAGCSRHQWSTLHHICKFQMSLEAS